LLPLAGCSKPDVGPKPQASGRHDEHDHAHAKGIKPLGDYHARLVVEQGGVLRLSILGGDETKVDRIEVQDVKGHVRAAGTAEAVPVTLKPEPQPGDPAGRTSQFVGQVPENLRGKPLVVTLRLTIAGEAYQPEFETGGGDAHAGHKDAMPAGVARGGPEISAAEKELYLTPGGLYTQADIEANGNTVPSVKFKGIQWAHDDLHPGEKAKVCPVTDNKADDRCTWIVGGKKYTFCCPPCLDKFLGWAKTNPAKVKDPSEYVSK
jgi:hypothetical protein